MKINWRFWTKTGKTFFNKQVKFVIDSDVLETTVAVLMSDQLDEKHIYTKAEILEHLDYLIRDNGSPQLWDDELISVSGRTCEELRSRAKPIVKQLFPEAYKIVNK